MGENWSEIEIEATVGDYFAMLSCELRGQKYSKAEHRRQLVPLLRGRSPAAVERKHQNISAVLLELGLPYIDGYKPLGNYQSLLKRGVLDWLAPSAHANQLVDIADEPAPQPTLPTNPMDLLVDIPKPISTLTFAPSEQPRVGRYIDYARREASNRTLGRQGEEFALAWEAERLRQCGRADLARKVEWVSELQGDGLGYDIASFDHQTEEPVAIEVKTTRGGQYHPFFVTRNEADVSQERGGRYRLYRLFRFATQPHLFIVPGPLANALILEPYTYRASLRR